MGLFKWFKEAKLTRATSSGNIELVKSLLTKGINVNCTPANGFTPLMLASSAGHVEIVKLLLSSGAFVNPGNDIGLTALMLASRDGQIETVKILLEHGADVNAKDNNGNTAKTHAFKKAVSSISPYPEIVELLKGYMEKNNIVESVQTPNQLSSDKDVTTYADSDYATHVTMATNDLCSIFGSAMSTGNIDKNREWIKNVGHDLNNSHGLKAMQEVFSNVKARYPMFQTTLSSLWDGVGDWAD